MSDEEKQRRGQRMRDLRIALGFKSQEALADASPDGKLERTYVVRAETGANAVTTSDLQRRFADALKLRVEDFADYLNGRLELEELVRRRNAFFHTNASAIVDLSALELVTAVNELPGLREWIESADCRLNATELAAGIAKYKQTRPSSRIKDRSPSAGWGAFFRDVLGDAVMSTVGGVEDVNRLAKKQIGPRPKISKK